MTGFEVLISIRASLWLDTKNRKYFGCCNEAGFTENETFSPDCRTVRVMSTQFNAGCRISTFWCLFIDMPFYRLKVYIFVVFFHFRDTCIYIHETWWSFGITIHLFTIESILLTIFKRHAGVTVLAIFIFTWLIQSLITLNWSKLKITSTIKR